LAPSTTGPSTWTELLEGRANILPCDRSGQTTRGGGKAVLEQEIKVSGWPGPRSFVWDFRASSILGGTCFARPAWSDPQGHRHYTFNTVDHTRPERLSVIAFITHAKRVLQQENGDSQRIFENIRPTLGLFFLPVKESATLSSHHKTRCWRSFLNLQAAVNPRLEREAHPRAAIPIQIEA